MSRLIGLALLALAGVAATPGGGQDANHKNVHAEVRQGSGVVPMRMGDGQQQEPRANSSASNQARGFVLRIHGLARDGIAAPEPVATAVPEPTRDAPVYGAGVEDIIRAYDWPDDYAIAVAWCESKFDPHAYNPASGASGVFQLIPYWHSSRLGPGESWFDAEANVRVAYELWTEQGWHPWNVGGCP